MAQTTTSAPQQQVAMPAVDLRQLYGTTISFEGVRGANDLAVAQRAAGANMSVDVAAGGAAIQDDHASGGGFYGYTLAATTNVAVTGADPTNPRIDRVVIRVRDQALGDAANDMVPVVVAGTATAGATLSNLTGAAAVPASSLLLANILVPAASSTVTTANIDTTVRRIVNDAAYTEITATVNIAATTEGSPGNVILGPTITLDGATTILATFFAPSISSPTVAGASVVWGLFDGATEVTRLGSLVTPAAAQMVVPAFSQRRLTPSAGTHTFGVLAWASVTTGTPSITAGTGSGTAYPPAFLRISRY